uniref:Uncharacterized protein n=1 Tax=Spironucleus salmonicida TaxID=348837 RepID=V6LFV1_9EUKA|eukprot:EST43382.1 Hypothetical protein SS50377_17062 [Spironucleus salmonicida]
MLKERKILIKREFWDGGQQKVSGTRFFQMQTTSQVSDVWHTRSISLMLIEKLNRFILFWGSQLMNSRIFWSFTTPTKPQNASALPTFFYGPFGSSSTFVILRKPALDCSSRKELDTSYKLQTVIQLLE